VTVRPVVSTAPWLLLAVAAGVSLGWARLLARLGIAASRAVFYAVLLAHLFNLRPAVGFINGAAGGFSTVRLTRRNFGVCR
jgi:hypothetical protein